MLSALVLASAFLSQAPAVQPAPVAPKVEADEKPQAAPAPVAPVAKVPRTTLERKRDMAAATKKRRAEAQAAELAQQKAWAAYVEKMGPVVAAQQRQAWLDQQKMIGLQLQAQQTQAMQQQADAAAKLAEVERQRLQLEAAEAYRNRFNR